MPEVTHVQIASIWIDVSVREQHNSRAEATHFPVEEGSDITDNVTLMHPEIVIEGLVTNQPIELPGSHTDGATARDAGYSLQLGRTIASGTRSTTIEGEPSLGFLGLVPGVEQGAALLQAVGADVRSKRKFSMVTPDMQNSTQTLQATALQFSKPFDRIRAVDAALRSAFESKRPVQVITALRVYEAVVMLDLSVLRDPDTRGALKFGFTGEVIQIVKSSSGLVGAPDPLHPRGKPAINQGNKNTAPVPAGEVPTAAKARISALEQAIRALGGG